MDVSTPKSRSSGAPKGGVYMSGVITPSIVSTAGTVRPTFFGIIMAPHTSPSGGGGWVISSARAISAGYSRPDPTSGWLRQLFPPLRWRFLFPHHNSVSILHMVAEPCPEPAVLEESRETLQFVAPTEIG